MEHLQHFHLNQDPFQNEPDLRFYFDSANHRDVQLRLERGLRQHKGLCVLTGEPGADEDVTVSRAPGSNIVEARGLLPKGEEWESEVAVEDPALFAVTVFEQALEARGIWTSGGLSVSSEPLPGASRVLVVKKKAMPVTSSSAAYIFGRCRQPSRFCPLSVSQFSMCGAPKLVRAAPAFPAPKIPKAVPCRRLGNQTDV